MVVDVDGNKVVDVDGNEEIDVDRVEVVVGVDESKAVDVVESETLDVDAVKNWYKLSALGPPQYSDEFPAHAMLQPLEMGEPPLAI